MTKSFIVGRLARQWKFERFLEMGGVKLSEIYFYFYINLQ